MTILSGAEDRAITPATVRDEVAARLSGSVMSTVPNAGHLLPLETPELVAREIARVAAR